MAEKAQRSEVVISAHEGEVTEGQEVLPERDEAAAAIRPSSEGVGLG